MQSRKDKILKHVNKSGFGIEIGPSHNPITPKASGYNVHIIDYMPKASLLEKYKNHHIDLSAIEEVDYVWQGESYTELTGKRKYYDWMIASHVIEHTPDLVDFLLNCDEILNDNGVLSLVIPDKRFCFDHFRPLSSLAHIIDHHFYKDKIHSPGTVAEYFLNVVRKNSELAWSRDFIGEYKFIHTQNEAKDALGRVANNKEYMDVHAWCFTPNHFRLLIHDLNSLGIIAFQEIEFFDNEDSYEFFISLGRKGSGPGLSRMEMLELIDSELVEKTLIVERESKTIKQGFLKGIFGNRTK